MNQGICTLAETLLHDYARLTGVNWTSRVILGKNPLFSQVTDLIHLRFPDWDIWNLPLMAHEFGHVTAFATPAFLELLAQESASAIQGHPETSVWDEKQTQTYIEQRGRHFHEFFADAFAIYCQGPAFAYDVLLLNLNPAEAYLPRGDHPSHAERVEVIVAVLELMNRQEKRDDYEPGPYAPVIGRLKEWWTEALEEAGAMPDEVFQFHKIKAKTLAEKIYNLLERNYRLEAQYQAEDWKRATETAQHLLTADPDLSSESLRDLLNIAWACRVRYPDRAPDIAKRIQQALTQSP
jgi:hypothetical protein